MRRNILFIMNNLHCGGAEKALISLLQNIDYSNFEVDLLLFQQEGIFMDQIPSQVNLLDEPVNYNLYDMSIKTALMKCIRNGDFKNALNRILAGYIFRSEKNKARCEQRVWRYLAKSLSGINKSYDLAVGYLEKTPIYFCVDRVNASKKIGFIHNDYDKLGMDPIIDDKYFKQLNRVVTVSEECVEILKRRFPQYSKKVDLMLNVVSPNAIQQLAMSEIEYKKHDSEIVIVSVGRLHYQKGFELAIEACGKLISDGYRIKWYVIGEGGERSKLQDLIRKNQLEDCFILVGLKENPYPYINMCDIYVQTSRFEGRCLTITEAKILHKPIVSTNFKVIYDQITDQSNGIIVKQTPESIYKGIRTLIDDPKLRNRIINNLKNEDMGTEREVEKIYNYL